MWKGQFFLRLLGLSIIILYDNKDWGCENLMSMNSQTKEQILETAYKLFREKGYNNVSISDICNAAGISATTFYYHYPTKEGLISKFFEQPPAVSIEMFERILAAETCWRQIWMLTESALEHNLAMGVEIQKQVIESNLNNNKGTFDSLNEKLMSLTIPLVTKAQQSGEIRNHNKPVDLINTGWQTLFGILTYWCITKGSFDLKKTVLQSQEILFDVRPDVRFEIE